MGIKRIKIWLLIAFVSTLTLPSAAQDDVSGITGRVVMFLPLHLDSIFTPQLEYRYKKGEFPRFVSDPLEFYQGFERALDSLKRRPGNIDVTVVDTRARNLSLPSLLEKDSIRNAHIWLFYGTVQESRQVAESAKKLQIPVININQPNSGGIKDNPYYFLSHPTLETECEGTYRFLQKNYPLQRILFVRKKGVIEDRILNRWEQSGQTTSGVPLQYSIIEVEDSISSKVLRAGLDTLQKILLVGGSMNDRFARNLATAATEMKAAGYKVELMGMSNWEYMSEFKGNRYLNLEITIPTPFHYPKTDALSKSLYTRFQARNFGKISEHYLRGYEMAWLLHPYLQPGAPDLLTSLTGKRKLLFAEIDWQPTLNKQTMQTEYVENKKLYFVKRVDGIIRSVR